ncbi:TPA: PerC family transcriptional regulator [Escherichia coli]|nr:PerC family transcriptional regulator [Escherichia coli]
MSRKKSAPEVVEDTVAQKLEAAGYWRRASARWGKLMRQPGYTEKQREWLYRRKIYCQMQIKPARSSDRPDICEISEAADVMLRHTGIADDCFFTISGNVQTG